MTAKHLHAFDLLRAIATAQEAYPSSAACMWLQGFDGDPCDPDLHPVDEYAYFERGRNDRIAYDSLVEPKTSRGQLICTKERPMPRLMGEVPGHWVHPDLEINGTCSEGCCDRYTCPHCGFYVLEEQPA